jgi:hypothetical protein
LLGQCLCGSHQANEGDGTEASGGASGAHDGKDGKVSQEVVRSR